jgi:hypothetical protein
VRFVRGLIAMRLWSGGMFVRMCRAPITVVAIVWGVGSSGSVGGS